jgi:hypothetical protein
MGTIHVEDPGMDFSDIQGEEGILRFSGGGMWWWELVAYTAVIAAVWWVVLDLWRQRGKKGPLRLPLVGSLVEVLWNYHRLHDWSVSYLKDSPTLQVDIPDYTITYTVLPENVEHILKNNFPNYPKVHMYVQCMFSCIESR